MPRKQPKKKSRSAATVAAAAALHHSSREIDDFTQQLMDAMAHAGDTAVGVLQPSPSFSEEREEGALDGMIPPCVASDNNNNNNNSNNNKKRMRSGSMHAEESPEKKGRGRTPLDERGKAGTRTRLSSTSDMSHRMSEALLRGKVSRGVVGPAVIELRHEGATRTEAEALQQHDSLSQLNTLCLPGNENAGERGASPGSHSAVDDTVDECRRLWRRRRELSQIPPGALALYTRLAECGVNAVDRPFATCVVGRAIQVMEEWATSFSPFETTASIPISPLHDALVVVDVQNDFVRPDGALAIPGAEDIVQIINAVRRDYSFRTVVATQDWHPPDHVSFAAAGGPWPVHCVQWTDGAAFHPRLQLGKVGLVVRKGGDSSAESYSAFSDERGRATGLAAFLRELGVRRVFICGVALDYCVYYTALDARRENFDVVVIEDATRAVFPHKMAKKEADMMRQGVTMAVSDSLARYGLAPSPDVI